MSTTAPQTATRRFARYAALVAVPLFIGLLSACSAGGTPEETPAAKEQSFEAWQVSYAVCMREEGIEDFPDPDPSGRIQAQTQDVQDGDARTAAAKACREKLGEPPAAPGEKQLSDEEITEQGIKTAQCFRDNGFDVPDPKDGQLASVTSDIPQDILEKCLGEAPVGGKSAG
ncbi:hypothetical protein ACL9RL_13995 [Plantibacter sp. Mn2098]|uniref:hypothetical protein n=1 Tax=Plantibacter sp. Mn2098 TaxID=3395266 RepID=UPI003BBBDEF8